MHRLAIIITPLLHSQYSVVAGDLTTVVGVRSPITIADVHLSRGRRLYKGARFEFSVFDDNPEGSFAVLNAAIRAVRFRYGSSANVSIEAFMLPALHPSRVPA